MQRVWFALEDAWANLRQSGWGTVASIGAIAVSFLVVGILLLVTINLGRVLSAWTEDFQVIVFLEDRITPPQRAFLEKRLAGELAVRTVTYTSKEEALRRFRQELTGQESLLDGLEGNPLPASFQLTIHPEHQTAEGMAHLAAALKRMEGVEDILYGQEWIDRLTTIVRILTVVGVTIGGILGAASIFIVANTIRVAVYARAEEIEIMRFVGATRAFIRTPFVIEGTLQGGLGALLALGILFLAHRTVLWQLGGSLSIIHVEGLGQFVEPRAGLAFVASGTLLGALGSMLAVHRFLRT
ncbi:MAG: permease-like cell division protein FtsX [Candidatus Methylomirabilales bacterium]